MSFSSSWTKTTNATGHAGGCSSAFMAMDFKHTSVNLQDLGFGRNNARNESTPTTSSGIWSALPTEFDRDPWLRDRRESSGSSADSGVARSFGSIDETYQCSRSADFHPFGKISRPRAPPTVTDLLQGLRVSSSHQPLAPTYSSSNTPGPVTTPVLQSYDSSKVLFPLNPVAKDFVPKPKSWAAVVSAPGKGGKSTLLANGRQKNSVMSAAGVNSVDMSTSPTLDKIPRCQACPDLSPKPKESLNQKYEPSNSTPKKLQLEPNGFVPAFVQAQHERSLNNACKSPPTADSNGWMVMDGSNRVLAASSPTGEQTEPTNIAKLSPDDVLQRLRRGNCFNNPDLKSLELGKARYFVMKPLNERDVLDSIVRSEWSCTAYSGEQLDEVYLAHHTKGPVYLFFSVNGSGQFCGIARVTSRVRRHTSIWKTQDSSGKVSVSWIFVKDVPNSILRHISIDGHNAKPVTNCRDATEIACAEAQKMVKCIQSFTSKSSVLDTHVKDKDRRAVKRPGTGGKK